MFSAFAERIYSSPHSRKEEPDGDWHYFTAVWGRNQHPDQAGGDAASPGVSGGPQ